MQEPHRNATSATAEQLKLILGGEASAWVRETTICKCEQDGSITLERANWRCTNLET